MCLCKTFRTNGIAYLFGEFSDEIKTNLSPLVLAQCPPNELDFGIEEFFSEQNGIIDAQIWVGEKFGSNCFRTAIGDPCLRHGMLQSIQMISPVHGQSVAQEQTLKFNLTI